MSSPLHPRTAVITGITGQDGSYLAELLVAKGYEVHGLTRRVSSGATARIDHLLADPDEGRPGLVLHEGDLTDSSRLVSLLSTLAPDEIYHLGGQSDVAASFTQPEATADATGLGTIRLLEAVRMIDLDVRVFHAASAQMFGPTAPPQHEDSPFHPRSPHALAKVTGYWATRAAREVYGTHAVNGILFNHESPRRAGTFVTRRIARAAAGVALGQRRTVTLGNLDAVRDWGFAPEYVEGMWAMLQADEPADLVLATGTAYTVEDFARLCFAHVGLDWTRHVRFDERLVRPAEVDRLVGDPSKAARELGWRPRTFVPELARIMVDAELSALEGPVSGLTSLAG
ncbi:GDP-mannose 4,6-dehydratase [Actinomycetospora endophytica]|uniref:GDP-mannose 4,6-dehydratase n=1 Tax=Actinomycetospora endophytica TaxID=2291215 RepID=A0ABS8PCP8_9PSEU|nr:GDP-mannose 4,6-dehydratase [Actinomycetospora endophytica]MCD2196056.1 GDP-mannose 4,6-dehydratase [Actinomycetospora endophytica]